MRTPLLVTVAPETEPSAAPAPRTPQQKRGRRRVHAILDATARIMAEEGSGGVTMHRVAGMSRTSTGSMYHFFPDREALIRALAARHREALRGILSIMERDAAPAWPRLPTGDVVDSFLDPVLGYADENPDLPAVSRFMSSAGCDERRDERLDALIIRLGECLVASRVICSSPVELTTRAAVVIGILEGVNFTARLQAPSRAAVTDAALRREMKRAMVAYLDSFVAPDLRT